MNEEIKVHVVKYAARSNLVMRYVDPVTGRQVSKTTGTSRKREAERKAAKWEAELREGRYQKPIPQPTCKHCGEKFKAVRLDAKYCSSRCRVAAYRVKHAKKRSAKKGRKTKKSVPQDRR